MGIFDTTGGMDASANAMPNAQPMGYDPQMANLTPQQRLQMMQYKALQGAASTPYRGNAPGGGAANGVAQLVAALLARKKAAQIQQGLQPTGPQMTPTGQNGAQNPNALPPPPPAAGPVAGAPPGIAQAVAGLQPGANPIAGPPPSFGLGGGGP